MVQGHGSDLYKVDDSYGQIAVGMILPVLLLVILFIIRQAKYNAVRVHQFLPYKNRFVVFLSFWLILFLITSLPLAVYFGSWFAPGLKHNRSVYENDFEIIETNYTHFKLNGCFGSKESMEALAEENGDVSMDTYPCDYHINKTKDSIELVRFSWGYFDNYHVGATTMSIDQALNEIEAFIQVAKKYGAAFKTENPREILDVNISGSRLNQLYSSSGQSYNHVSNYEEFETAINVNESFSKNRNVFKMYDGEMWRYYSLIGFSIAFLLIIFCSVERAEFGWSMLVCALMPTAYGIILGLFALMGFLDGEAGAKLLLMLFVGAACILAFGNFKPSLKRIFGISLNIFLPIVLPIIFIDELFHKDLFVVLAFLLGLIVTFVFRFYYHLQYLHPRKT